MKINPCSKEAAEKIPGGNMEACCQCLTLGRDTHGLYWAGAEREIGAPGGEEGRGRLVLDGFASKKKNADDAEAIHVPAAFAHALADDYEESV